MYNNIDNMNVLFNIQNFNNINVQNDRLLNVDPDHNHDFQLPNCINVDPNDLFNQLSAATFSCLSLNISPLKNIFRHCKPKSLKIFALQLLDSMKQKLIQMLNNYITLQAIT